MDITQFAVGNRDSALLIGDYNSYRSQLSRQLLAARKRLGRATPKNAKFVQKPPISAENVGQDHGYAATEDEAVCNETEPPADMCISSCSPPSVPGRMLCT